MKRKEILLLLLMFLLTFLLSTTAAAASKPQLSKKSVSLYAGEKVRLKVTGVSGKVKWSSSRSEIASVNKSGNVKAIKTGKTTIKAKVAGKTLTCRVNVKKAALSEKRVTLEVGATKQIKLNGSKIKSASSNRKSIATITKKGKITAKAVGSCKLTIKGRNGKKYICKVTVVRKAVKETEAISEHTTQSAPQDETQRETQSAPQDEKQSETKDEPQDETQGAKQDTVLTSPDQMVQIPDLSACGVSKITIRSKEAASFVVPQGNFTETTLFVDLPNGEVTNQGSFDEIVVNAISSDTFIEKTTGNTIIYLAPSGTIRVDADASAEIKVDSANAALKLVNNGTVKNVALSAPANVTITGEKNEAIPVTAAPEAKDSTVVTDKNLRITAEAKLKLVLNEGAERTTANVTSNENIPEVSGLGSVTVENTADNTVETVVAENVRETERKVKITGTVTDKDNKLLPGVTVHLLKYSNSINIEEIETQLNVGSAKHADTDESGTYVFEDVSLGNYYLVAQAEGYESSVQTLRIESETSEVCNNGATILLPSGMAENGTITGVVKDAHTGEPVTFPVVLNVRNGRDNLSGRPLQTVEANADTNGSYSFEGLETGTYTIQAISKAGSGTIIVTTSENANVIGGESCTCDIIVSSSIANDGMRFVLSWGTEASGAPADLDSHLVGPTERGYKFHTWYQSRYYHDTIAMSDSSAGSGVDGDYYYDASTGEMVPFGSSPSYSTTLIAELDVDDREWEGPETTTIHHMASGVYSFYAYDFTNKKDEDSAEMSDHSDAVVRVYDADGVTPRATIKIPKGQKGTLWHVCDYDSETGALKIVNTVESWPDDGCEKIGTTQHDRLMNDLLRRIDILESYCLYGNLDGEDYDEYKEEALTLLEEARTFYQSAPNDVKEIQSMILKLDKCINRLQRVPYEASQRAIDGATPLSLGNVVNVNIRMGESAYYSYTPEESGDYTFVLRKVTERGYPSTNVYMNYYLYYSADDTTYSDYDASNGIRTEARTMTAGTKYTLRVVENYLDEAEYTLSVIKGNLFARLNRAIYEADEECRRHLTIDDPRWTEIEKTIEDARFALGTWNEAEAEDLLGKLEAYIRELEEILDPELKSVIDSATTLFLNESVTADVFAEVPVYYSFTPTADGEYTIIINTVTEKASPDMVVYEGYKRLDDDYDYYSTGVLITEKRPMTADTRYTFQITEWGDDIGSTQYTVTVVQNSLIADLNEAVANVRGLCERYLEDGDAKKTDIQRSLTEAKKLLASWKQADETEMEDLLEQLEQYEQELYKMPTLDTRIGIDNATALSEGEKVTVTVRPQESVYYSFTPSESGDYSFLLCRENDTIYISSQFYQGYEHYGNLYVNPNGYVVDLKAGIKYTLSLSNYNTASADCTLVVMPGSLPAELSNKIDTVESLCNSRLEDSDPYRIEVLQAVDEAKTLLDAWNEEKAKDLFARLEQYAEKLQQMPTMNLKDAIDNAFELTLGEKVSCAVEPGKSVYYSFTPLVSGDYSFVLLAQKEDICPYNSFYMEYTNYVPLCVHNGIASSSYALEEGTRYTVEISNYDYTAENAQYDIVVLFNSKIGKLSDIISSVEGLCNDRLTDGDANKVRIQQAIAEAKAVLVTLDEVKAGEMLTQFEQYERELSGLASSYEREQIDTAKELVAGVGTKVVTAPYEGGLYYSFTPTESGDYSFVLCSKLDGAPYGTFYKGYGRIGTLNRYDHISEQVISMEANVKYTLSFSNSFNEENEYTVIVAPGRQLSDFGNKVWNLTFMCDSRLEDGDAYKSEIQEAIKDAWMLFDKWDETKADEMLAQFATYEQELQKIATLETKKKIDTAAQLTIGVGVNGKVKPQKNVYYSFTPPETGVYSFALYTDAKDEYMYSRFYKGYVEYDSLYVGTYIASTDITAKAYTLEANVTYTWELELCNNEAEYKLIAAPGDCLMDLCSMSYSVNNMCDIYLEEDDAYRTKIQETIAEVWDLLDTWDAEKAEELLNRFKQYQQELQDMPLLWLKKGIDGATELTAGVGITETTGSYESRYYSFTPSESGDYSFVLCRESDDEHLSGTIYQEYEFLNGLYSDYISSMPISLKAGIKYTISCSNSDDKEAAYTVIVAPGRQISDFGGSINSLISLCKNCLEDGSAYKTEVQQCIANAKMLLKEWDETNAEDILLQIEQYERELYAMPTLESKKGIDAAANLNIGEMVTGDLSSQESAYYSFSPVDSGDYSFVILSDTENVNLSCTCYKEYKRCNLAYLYSHGITESCLSLEPGSRYSIEMSNISDKAMDYALLVVPGGQAADLSIMIRTLDDLCNSRLEENDSYRVEIEQAITDARALFRAWDSTRVEEMLALLVPYREELQRMPDFEERKEIDVAPELILDMSTEMTVQGYQNCVYFSYTPEEDGDYNLSVSGQEEPAYLNCRLYVGYDWYTELSIDDGSNGMFTLTKGKRYTFALKKYTNGDLPCTITLSRALPKEADANISATEPDMESISLNVLDIAVIDGAFQLSDGASQEAEDETIAAAGTQFETELPIDDLGETDMVIEEGVEPTELETAEPLELSAESEIGGETEMLAE